ncbi:hypothetical protein M9H77_13827 [Catharanthus roseus]|uniref:Uncharacterized protein n=1 Tax=Catharanthus roseus TaxID=4058 RepID=A0ACC0BLH4_CATRO|nr:hypothetical protein M9H77_13827 [Catharanthus roseus]
MSEEKRENSKEEFDVLKKSEEINFFANQTNSSLVKPSKNQEGRLGYNFIKTISFFPSNSYLCFEIYFKEIKLFSLIFIEHGDHFTFLNPLGTYLERRYFIEFNSISCAIPRVHDYDFYISNCVSCVLGVEDRRGMEKELGHILEDLSISLSLNPSSLCYEVSLEELKSLLESYTFQMITFPVELNIVGFVLEFDGNSLQHVCTITSTRGRRYTMEFEGQGKNVGGKQILLNFRKKMNGSLKVLKAHLCDLVKTTFGNGVFELNLKNLVEKHLVYSSAFVDFLFKAEALNETIVQSTKSCVNIENHSLGANLLYSLTFKEFLDELIFKRELKVLQILIPFKELCYLWNSCGVQMLVDKRDVLFTYSLLSLECFCNIHSIVPFSAFISNVAHLLWLFERLGSRTYPFKGGADGMTRERYENTESFQGSVIWSRARKIKEETQRNKFGRS